VGDFVYVAGQGPFDPVTDEIRGATIEEQMRLTFKNIAALLAAAGSSLANVIKVNVYLRQTIHQRCGGLRPWGRFRKHAAPLTGKGDFDEIRTLWLPGVPIPVLIVIYLVFH
jgi:enamine deaminase RidA (YjgF/YER057c/UK114 family)